MVLLGFLNDVTSVALKLWAPQANFSNANAWAFLSLLVAVSFAGTIFLNKLVGGSFVSGFDDYLEGRLGTGLFIMIFICCVCLELWIAN